ncbi:uncharacterized protein LOC115125781 isoform X1 [Oncorhynchus nerka]|uniref:uncharacterized protein LOC115125781 isoform X1 n=1 Tax=Oncorhynchus nerka TaxID=8023 RepID=UPI0031B82FB8
MEFACSHVVCNWSPEGSLMGGSDEGGSGLSVCPCSPPGEEGTTEPGVALRLSVTEHMYDNRISVIPQQEPGLVPPPLPPRRFESQKYPQCTSLPPPPPPLSSLPPPLPARGAEGRGEQSIRLKANVNVLSLSVGRLVDISRASGIQTTQCPVMHCGRCSAALSSLSSVQNTQETAVWLCEFCGLQNTLSTSGPGSKVGLRVRGAPRGRDVIYLLRQTDQDYENLEDVMVVFCVDISGSMSVTSEVTPGNPMRSATYVSRLQVVVYGDGSGVPASLRDWALVDYDYLRQQGQQYNTPHCIAESYQHLSLRVKE